MSCSICSSEKGPLVNSMLASGRSANFIEGEMKRLDKPTKAETVRRHLERCLNGNAKGAVVAERRAGTRAAMGDVDFATAIREEAQRLLDDGKLHVRAEHGLQAQALIDRRAERAADRQLMIQMAGLLAGGRIEQVPDDLVIEGEWQEVEAEVERSAPLELVSSG